MIRCRWSRVVCILACLAALPGLALAQAEPAARPDAPRLAVAALREGKLVIVSIDVDGKNEEVLVTDPKAAMEPHWSPDGKSLAFVSFRSGPGQIYVADLTTGKAVNVTDSDKYERTPSWSPDGKQLVFTSNRTGEQELFVINRDGSAVTNLTNAAESYDADPVWSPDGKRIAFVAMRDGRPFRLYAMDADGTNQRLLCEEDLSGWVYPDWSPNGKQIVVGQFNPDGSVHLNLVEVSTGKLSPITKGAGTNSFARWSPDGRYIAYASFSERPPAYAPGMELDPEIAGGDLMLYDVKSGEHRRVLAGQLPVWGPRPAWKPLAKGGEK